jgi:two-component system sensor histidine kinase MprB
VTWWRRRTLRSRLSLLVTGAVAAAVVTIAVISWVAVAEIQRHQLYVQLNADATAIAAQPDQFRGGSGPPPVAGERGPRQRGPRRIAPQWQIISSGGTIVQRSASPLPITEAARRVASGEVREVQEPVTISGEQFVMVTVAATGGGAVQVAVDPQPNDAVLTLFGLLLIALCVAGVGGAALLGRAVARAGLVPVEKLTNAVEDRAATMDLSHPIPAEGADEIARLGTSVNTLLAAIDTSRRAQRTLVEDAGHELRTPMTSIRTNIELLLEVERRPDLAHRLPPEERTKLLRDLESQVAELAGLTTELVELAREETTRETAEPVDLADVVDAAVARVRIRAPGLTFTTALDPVTVRGRPGELERMVVNVLDNAAKWSPPGGTVTVGLHPGDTGRTVLTVADTGPGIDEADRPYVFDRFYRSAAARALPGSGLGLAIVAQTATQHGGTVTAAPDSPHGTVVTIDLPYA